MKKINLYGNNLKVNRSNFQMMKGINNNERYNFDLYELELKTLLVNQEISITVDFINQEIEGNVVKFGGWYDLEKEEIMSILNQIKQENKILRSFDFI